MNDRLKTSDDGSHVQTTALLGVSPEICRVRDQVRRLADTRLSVLLTGETGVGKQLVDNVAFAGYADGTLTLALDSGFDYLRSARTLGELRDAIASRYGVAPRLAFAAAAEGGTLKQRSHRQRDEQQNVAEETFMNHPDVRQLMQQHGARLVPDSIRPYEE